MISGASAQKCASARLAVTEQPYSIMFNLPKLPTIYSPYPLYADCGSY